LKRVALLPKTLLNKSQVVYFSYLTIKWFALIDGIPANRFQNDHLNMAGHFVNVDIDIDVKTVARDYALITVFLKLYLIIASSLQVNSSNNKPA